MAIGLNIAKLRKQKSWTQKKLALDTGLSKGYIAAIEEEKVHPTVKTLVIIAHSLGVSLKALREGRWT